MEDGQLIVSGGCAGVQEWGLHVFKLVCLDSGLFYVLKAQVPGHFMAFLSSYHSLLVLSVSPVFMVRLHNQAVAAEHIVRAP